MAQATAAPATSMPNIARGPRSIDGSFANKVNDDIAVPAVEEPPRDLYPGIFDSRKSPNTLVFPVRVIEKLAALRLTRATDLVQAFLMGVNRPAITVSVVMRRFAVG
jgi:hypothetical protein